MLFAALLASLALYTNTVFAEHDPETHESKEAATVPEEEHAQAEEHSSEEAEHGAKEEHEHEHIVETSGPHVHSSATALSAQWVGVGTLVAAAAVFGIKVRSPNKLAYRYVVLALALGTGIMHVLLTPDHLADVSVEHAVFFAVAGTAWIGFGPLFTARPGRNLAIVGIVGAIGIVALYFITRIEGLPPPIGAPEGIDPVGIVSKIIEISLLVVLAHLAVYLKRTKPVEIGRPR